MDRDRRSCDPAGHQKDFRQDAGIGATVRLRGHVLAQTYFAWGAGHGAQWNYNFAKSF